MVTVNKSPLWAQKVVCASVHTRRWEHSERKALVSSNWPIQKQRICGRSKQACGTYFTVLAHFSHSRRPKQPSRTFFTLEARKTNKWHFFLKKTSKLAKSQPFFFGMPLICIRCREYMQNAHLAVIVYYWKGEPEPFDASKKQNNVSTFQRA